MHELFRHALQDWRAVSLIIALVAWCGLELGAATVSTHAFGRYEIVIQEGTPFAIGEILGMVRRQTGLPEYPLMLGVQKRLVELSILGPGNRPIPLASTKSTWPAGAPGATMRLVVERSVRQEDTLILRLRRAGSPGEVSLAVNLRHLERMLEGER